MDLDLISEITDALKETSICKKLPAAKIFKNTLIGQASAFPLTISNDAKAYRYTVQVALTKNEGSFYKVLTSTNDFAVKLIGSKQTRKDTCCRAVELLIKESGDECLVYAYDGVANLITNKKVTANNNKPTDELNLQLKAENFTKECRGLIRSCDVIVKIAKCDEDFEVPIGNKDIFLNGALSHKQKLVHNCLEMITSQFAINNNMYFSNNNRTFHMSDTKFDEPISHGKILKPGVCKSVRFIDASNEDKVRPAVFLDMSKNVFYKAGNLLDIIRDMTETNDVSKLSKAKWNDVLCHLENVLITPNYRNAGESYKLKELSDADIGTLIMRKDDQAETRIVDYYQDAYKIRITETKIPAVVVKSRGQENFYPMCHMNICSGQTVPLNRMDSDASASQQSNNTVKPYIRKNEIIKHLMGLGLLNESNKIMKGFKMSLNPHAVTIKLGIRHPPILRSGKGEVFPDEKGSFGDAFRQPFYSPAKIESWALIYNREFGRDASQFLDQLMRMCSEKGMKVEKPMEVRELNGDFTSLKEAIKDLANKKIRFVMHIEPKVITSHELLKYYETKYCILTQQVTTELCKGILEKGQRQSLANVINKMNVKNGGINIICEAEKAAEKFCMSKDSNLVVGYSLSHPKCTGDPSIVGFSANFGSDPHQFIGDFFFQTGRKHEIDPVMLEDTFTNLLKKRNQNRPKDNKLPAHIIILRDGLTDVQFKTAIELELSALRRACENFEPGYKPGFVMIVVNKHHNKRFFNIEENLISTNFVTGVVIDSGCTRADYTEFYLQAHRPVIGTSKIPQYSMIVNEVDMNLDECQGLILSLAYSHQIITNSVSLPEPIYQAGELAKRGNYLFNIMRKEDQARLKMTEEGQIDLKSLNKLLTYGETNLHGQRFTA
uniref:Piwi domain-containing protein n=1 Tax=Rhabditophanes sp. KR3021 TaxID=114890 RepID=A0AC35U400_9BILA